MQQRQHDRQGDAGLRRKENHRQQGDENQNEFRPGPRRYVRMSPIRKMRPAMKNRIAASAASGGA